MIPARFKNAAAARGRYGDRIDRLAPYLLRTDPLADALAATIAAMPEGQGWSLFNDAASKGIASVPDAPAPFRAFFEQVEHVPAWVDWKTIDRGGNALMRAGPLGGIVLGVKSLVHGYASPAGNKPLIFSGRLKEQASRRLNETARFVQAVCSPRGLRPHADGYLITLRVRVIHAHVRLMIARTGRWNEAEWGAPANQHDMAGTQLLFSLSVLEGLRTLGVRFSRDDADRYMQLWRYVGHLIGVDAELQPTSEYDAARLAEIIAATQGDPDDDSRALTAALLGAPLTEATTPTSMRNAERRVRFAEAMCRELVGDELADKLAVPRTSWRLAVPLVRRLVSGAELLRESVPFTDRHARAAGNRYWERVVEVGLAGATAEFGLPDRLAPVAA
jgi:hypothetical protein